MSSVKKSVNTVSKRRGTAGGRKFEKRDAVLFARITPDNKTFIEKMSDEKSISESMVVDYALTWFRNHGQFLDDAE